MNKFTRKIAAIAAGIALAAGASLAVAAPANAVVRSSFPAYSTVISPKALTAPWYSKGDSRVVNVAACPTGKAEQRTFYQYIRFAGGFQPNWSAPVKIEVCK